MKLKKAITGFLTVTLITSSVAVAFASNKDVINETKQIVPISASTDDTISVEEIEEQKQQMGSVTGKVKEINNYKPIEGSKFVSLENEEGEIIANLIVSDDTYILDNEEIEIGDTVTGYYDANAPMILIYPPQFSPEAVVIEREDRNVKVDVFDENLVSSDNMLKLNISDDTEILLQDGTLFEEDLTGRTLVVIYGASTKSIPAQTTPSKIIVLFKKEEQPTDEMTDEEAEEQFLQQLKEMAANADIMVEGKKIEAPPAFMTDEKVVMVPLRAIAEALQFDIIWDGELQKIMLGKTITLSVGENYYTYAKMAPIELECAPQIVEDRTFVPISFFREVVKMNNAYMFEGQIVIDNEEKME